MENQIHIIAGLLLIAFGVFNLVVIQLRKYWPEAAAEVLICKTTAFKPDDLNPYVFSDSADALNSIRNPRPFRSKPISYHDEFKPSLVYRYKVGDEEYISQNMYSGPFSKLDTGIVRFFSEGNHYPARYNSNNPEKSYLMFSSLWPYLLAVIAGAAVVFYQPLFELGSQLYGVYISEK